MVRLNCYLNGIDYDSMIELNDLEVSATFDNEVVQPNINIQSITFVNEAAQAILEWGQKGADGVGVGYLEGMPVVIKASDSNYTIPLFDGFIDFTQEFTIVNPAKIKCKLQRKNGLNDFSNRLSAMTFGLMYQNGDIVDANFRDVRTVVVTYDQTMELLMLAFMELTLAKELAALSINIGKNLNLLLTQPTSSAATVAANLILDIVYAAVIIVQYIKMGKKLIMLLFPIPIINKGITYFTGLEKISLALGYDGFNTSIPEIKEWVYLPSKTDYKEKTKGVPQSSDFGYKASEFFEIVLRMFDAKVAIVNDQNGKAIVQVHNRNSVYWGKVSKFDINGKVPISSEEQIVYNIDEFRANKILSFQTDTTDEWTVKNFTGTNYEVITEPIIVGDIKNRLYKGLEDVMIPTALGNPNDLLVDFQKQLLSISASIDRLLLKFGSGVTISPSLSNRGAPLKVSSTTWNVPKTLAVKSNGNLYVDQKERISAKYLYNNYHHLSSFMPASSLGIFGNGQKQLFYGVKIPFGFTDFMALITCSYFSSGNGKIKSVVWKYDKDYAVADYWVKKVWTTNLKQTFIEP